ncbi:MAG: threonine/serine dehydratase [Bryobacterales bacterium]|nr:threonine/serine dehydratase [Bryobacterales bacterium]
MSVTFADIEQARERIRPLAKRTPVLTSRGFDMRAGVRTFFKCENFQTGGAFKIRGAANRILSLTREELDRGVLAFSSGNHAQATAIAARYAAARATIVMPLNAPKAKLEATRAQGAEIVTYDPRSEDREAIARRLAAQTGAVLVPPFDHPKIIAGQGTAALELLEDAGPLDALVAPVGGGGLASGCALAAQSRRPGLRMFAAEPERANDTYLSFRAGERVGIPLADTIADGLRPPIPGELTFAILRERLEDVLLVSEEEILDAMEFLLTRLKILVEPSGAVAAAAVLFGKLPPNLGSVGVILSGGNVDLNLRRALG